MSKLMYSFLASLDGFVRDVDGNFSWATPDAEVHRFVNDLERSIGTHIYGRRMYETMAVWETDPTVADQSSEMAEYAEIWQAAEKVVCSSSLSEVWTQRTRLESNLDEGSLRKIKATSDGDVTISGVDLGETAWRLGLVDEVHVYICPVLVGDGLRMFPAGTRHDLRLQEERRFGNGMVFVRYAVANQ